MTIARFKDEYRFLSNFYPVEVISQGIRYYTVENAYQAAKTLDPGVRLTIVGMSPGAAKRFGQTVQLQPYWNDNKVSVMRYLLREKFRHADLAVRLLATGNEHLEEGNNWGDEFWGTVAGRGQNHLGQLLMAVRAELRSAK